MSAITSPRIVGGKAVFSESLHGHDCRNPDLRIAEPWQRNLRSFPVDAAVNETQLRSAVSNSLSHNNLDEIAIEDANGFHIVYGRGIAKEIAVGDVFVSDQVKGKIIAIDREVVEQRKKIELKGSLSFLATSGTATLAAIALSALVAPPLAILGGIASWFGLAIKPASSNAEAIDSFNRGTGEYSPDRSVYEPLAASSRPPSAQ